MIWAGQQIFVTGSASFLGSHLVDALVRLGIRLVVVGNLSSGRIDNLQQHIKAERIRFIRDDLRRW